MGINLGSVYTVLLIDEINLRDLVGGRKETAFRPPILVNSHPAIRIFKP
jgi:hypothetical protein